MEEKVWKRVFQLKRIWLLLLTPISILILFIAQRSTWIAEEIFARRIYKVVSHGITIVTGWMPLSVAEWTIILGPIILITILVVFMIRLIVTKKDIWFRIIKMLLSILSAFSLVFFIYTISCGVNYYRESIGVYLELSVQPSSEEELYEMSLDLSNRANELRSQITSVDDEGVYELSMSLKELGTQAKRSYQILSEKYEVFSSWYPKPKQVFFSRFMSRMEITGIFIPFTMESNVNVDIPDYSIASTMNHELAHLQGYMREDEANYISYLACTASDNVELQYSGVMEALILSGNALYDQNKELYYMIRDNYSEGVLTDLRANSAYWKQFENSKVSSVATMVNDTYLKVNNQTDGVKSYGRMVDLLLAEYRSKQSH